MDEEDRKPVFRELAVCKCAADCPYMVSYYGAFFGDVSYDAFDTCVHLIWSSTMMTLLFLSLLQAYSI